MFNKKEKTIAIGSDTEITPLPYRPCTVRGKSAVFHRWVEKKEIVIQERSPSAYQMLTDESIAHAIENVRKGYVSPDFDIYTRRETVAIVEYEDGTVDEISPTEIKFTESPSLILNLKCDNPYINFKELTEEYESMANSVNEASELIRKLKRDKEILELQIEAKERICESYMLQYGTVADKEVWLKKEREATIQKYREALYRAFARSDSKDKFNKEVFLTKADQIAKEVLEGTELKALSTADMVEVVRCKDCRRWTPDGGYGLDLDGTKRLYGECSITKMSCKENHFCCFGHKKDEEGDKE